MIKSMKDADFVNITFMDYFDKPSLMTARKN